MNDLKELRDQIEKLPYMEIYGLFSGAANDAIERYNAGGSLKDLSSRLKLALQFYDLALFKETMEGKGVCLKA